jgi:AraC-like DNA-binding protein
MHVQRFQVDPRLTAYIESIWTFETAIGLPANDLCTIIVPSARPKLVIPYRGLMFSEINNRRIEHPQASMILVGMMERSVVIDSSAIGVLAIEFKPGTLYRFLGFPLKEVTNTAYPLEVVLGQLGQGLQQRLQSAPDPAGIAHLAQDFLLRQLDALSNEHPLVDYAVKRIQASIGLIRINELCIEVGYSKRYLDRLFGAHIGLSPKLLARILRFQHVYRRWVIQPSAGNFQDDIYDLYYDQAHFVKEFKQFTGSAPRAYTRQIDEVVRSVYQQ